MMKIRNVLVIVTLVGLLIFSVGTMGFMYSFAASPQESITLPKPQISKDSGKFQASADANCNAGRDCVNPLETAVFLLGPVTVPDPAIQCEIVLVSGPSGSSITEKTIANTCKSTWKWPNAGPSGIHEASFQTKCRNVPPDKQCIDSIIVTFKVFVNHLPVANAGPDKNVNSGVTVNLDGTKSHDEDEGKNTGFGDQLTFTWTQGQAPPTVKLDNPDSKTASFKAPVVSSNTKLTFGLLVSDGKRSSTDSVVITVLPSGSTTCPPGQTGTPPNCKPIPPPPTCPPGQIGTPPDCEPDPDKCPPGTTGTPPNCTTVRSNACVKNTFQPTNYVETKEFYNIQASSLSQAEAKFKFRANDGHRIASVVSWSVDLSKMKESFDQTCSNSVLSVEIKYIQPLFTNVKQLSQAAQNEWNRYLQASLTYLKSDVDILRQFFDDIVKKVKGKSQEDAIKIIDQITLDARKAMETRDINTNFGATQGVVLNVNIGAPPPTVLTILQSSSVQGNPDYSPDPLVVTKGDRITVTNKDTVPHSVTRGFGVNDPNSGKGFDTSIITPGQSANILTINLGQGAHPYYCTVHPFMKGLLIVN